MSPDALREVQSDIAYMRGLAEEGRKTPLLGGSILILGGVTFAAAAVAHWAVARGVLALDIGAVAWIWLAAFAVFMAGLFVIRARVCRMPGAWSPVNRAAGTAWMAAGQMIFVMALSILIVTWRHDSSVALQLFPSLIFAAYGVGWAVAAAMSESRRLWWLAIGAWVAAPLIAFMSGSPEQLLVYALGLLVLTLPPGLALVRAQPSEIV